MKKKLVVVGGPTASGKTSLAINLALRFNTVIISADSRQFYKELTIGTAKPDAEQLSRVTHFFINSHSIHEPLFAGDYGVQARELIHSLKEKHDVIIVAGGSGLYIDALISGMDDLPPASPELRAGLAATFNNLGIEGLQQLLKQHDPATYEKIDIQNPRRMIRALEVTLSSGRKYSGWIGNRKQLEEFEIILTAIEWPRDVLYERINRRVDEMIQQGLREEAEALIAYKNLAPLQTVGYKEMFDFFDNKSSFEEAVQKIAQNTRNYAKRQLTWFRKYPGLHRIKPGEEAELIRIICES